MIEYIIYAFAIIGFVVVAFGMCAYVEANINARRYRGRDLAAEALNCCIATNSSTETSLLIVGDVSALTGVGMFFGRDETPIYTKLAQINEPSVTEMQCLYPGALGKSLYKVHFANVLDTIAFKLRYSNDLTFVEGGAA